ncbi:polysaccharide biosynthesis C-terminal domain-containing protein [Aureispira sp. CCB-E]|uniref:lipopolysaccharide biosynthesis protein n=1 Tax=Aureispira sp. CCB-E TaxID=3051121 RepID=UPI00286887C3|nr:polysaccharide biosynthesis C-terminal domain-containing protein [Aureispira sp. CCB-E]WMX12674.1 polysaccharide biosynthesis C-terminal domain-containing protein [Aureispira sp. CCB-E]
MDELDRKKKQRLTWIVLYGSLQILPPLGQFLISYFVIRFNSEAAWGEIVNYLIFVNLAILFFNWGQNTYLIRAFSQNVQMVAVYWQESFCSRLVLLGLVQMVAIVFFYGDGVSCWWLSVWLWGAFGVRSFDPLPIYTRRLKGALSIEGGGLMMILIALWSHRSNLDTNYLLFLYAFLAVAKAMAYAFFYRRVVLKNWKWRFRKAFLVTAFPFFIPAMIGFVQSRIDLYGVAFYLSEETLGAYQVFFKAFSLFILGNRIIVSPFLKNIYRMPDTALQRLNHWMFGLGIWGTAPVVIAFYYLLPWIYGINFSAWMYGLGYLMIVPFFGYAIQTHHLIKIEKEKQLVVVFLGAAFANICCNYILIPTYGALGAIASTAIVQWLLFFVFRILLGKSSKWQKINN